MSEDVSTYVVNATGHCAFCGVDPARALIEERSRPRGGVDWVLPDKAAYWLSTEQ